MKTVLITGATGGIGEQISLCFAKAGYNVVIAYKQNETKAVELVETIGKHQVLAVCCDVSDSEQVDSMFQMIEKRFGGTDVLINNAGISGFGLFTDVTDTDWHQMMGVNLDGCFYCCRATLPYMIRQKSGTIINISSIWGITGGSCEVAYSAAKAGVIGLTKALAKEVGPSGITVNCIAPGIIDTPMNSRLSPAETAEMIEQTPLGQIGNPSSIGELALFLAEKGDFITGQVISPNGGLWI